MKKNDHAAHIKLCNNYNKILSQFNDRGSPIKQNIFVNFWKKEKKKRKVSPKIEKVGLTRDGKSNRTCRATHINLGQKALKPSPMHKKSSPSKGVENSEQLD